MVLEYPDRLESVLFYEVHEYLEVLISLTRESDDKGRTDKRSRKMRTNVLDKAIDMSTVVVASHELQDIFTRMLEWYIEVGKEVLELLKSLEVRECEDIWVEIIDTEFRCL